VGNLQYRHRRCLARTSPSPLLRDVQICKTCKYFASANSKCLTPTIENATSSLAGMSDAVAPHQQVACTYRYAPLQMRRMSISLPESMVAFEDARNSQNSISLSTLPSSFPGFDHFTYGFEMVCFTTIFFPSEQFVYMIGGWETCRSFSLKSSRVL